jgi:hypothetical protein
MVKKLDMDKVHVGDLSTTIIDVNDTNLLETDKTKANN